MFENIGMIGPRIKSKYNLSFIHAKIDFIVFIYVSIFSNAL